jgi:enoyl-CoA hydratase/carnithine racemase
MSATPTSDSPLILRQRDGDVVTVVLNRPEKLNAFTIDGWRLLGDTFLELDADDSVRCVLLRGAGG